MKKLVFAIATVCAGILIYTTVSISSDVVSYLMRLDKTEITFITATTLCIAAVFLAIVAYRGYRS
jgi:hypothetical protein